MNVYGFCHPVISSASAKATDYSTDDYMSEEDFLEDIKSELEKIGIKRSISIGLWSALGSRSLPLLYRVLVSLQMTYLKSEVSLQVFVRSTEVLDHLYRYMPWDFRPQKALTKAGRTIIITVGDIVPEPWVIEQEKEAIVNASNEDLILGGGVSDSIRRNAGPGLQKELSALAKNKLRIGEAAVTGAHGIPGVNFIVHVPTASGTEDAVFNGTVSALRAAQKKEVKRLVFPALGAGTGGLSIKACSKLMLKAMDGFFETDTKFPQVCVVKLWRKSDFELFVSG